MLTKGLIGLVFPAAIVLAFSLVFFYAPLDADQGFIQKIFYLHVPLAITALIGFVVGGIFAIAHLRGGDSRWDAYSYVSIHISVIFGVAVLITGSIWAKASWGHWWVWDEPTLVSFLIVFLMYATYYPFRYAIEDRDQQARYASVFAIVAGAFVPLNFIAVRMAQSLVHPRVFATAKKRILLRALMTAIVIALIFSAITFVIWQGAIDVAAGRITGGTIAAFVLYGGLLAGAFGALSEVYGDVLRAAGASERLNELLTAEPLIKAPAIPRPLPLPALGLQEHVARRLRPVQAVRVVQGHLELGADAGDRAAQLVRRVRDQVPLPPLPDQVPLIELPLIVPSAVPPPNVSCTALPRSVGPTGSWPTMRAPSASCSPTATGARRSWPGCSYCRPRTATWCASSDGAPSRSDLAFSVAPVESTWLSREPSR